MAYVAPRKNGSWEIRESHSTEDGPRSATLATFRELSDEVIERARLKAGRPLDADELRRAALRAGAPLAETGADRTAATLLRELSTGRKPRRALSRLLADAFHGQEAGLSDAARSVQEWVGATPEERGKTLRELLLLADALPQRGRPQRIEFPRLVSR